MGAHFRLRLGLALLAVTVMTAAACGQRPTAVLGRQVSGCADAVGERSAATAAIDLAAQQAVARNGARAEQLRGIAADGKRTLAAAADLSSCDDRSGRRGVALDPTDLRARYRVVIERTAAQLSETASQRVPQRAPPKRGDDTKGDDRKGPDRGRG